MVSAILDFEAAEGRSSFRFWLEHSSAEGRGPVEWTAPLPRRPLHTE